MSDITWGDSGQVRLPEFDVAWTSPPYGQDELAYRVLKRCYGVANEGALLWLLYPSAYDVLLAGWTHVSHCYWCLTESEIDTAYTLDRPIEAVHNLWLLAKGEHRWAPDYRMPNWIPGAPPEIEGAEYLTVPQEVVTECLGASMPSEGKVFLDPFSGTGTTVCAAHAMGYEAHGIEINEAAVKNSRLRLRAMDIQLPSELHQ